MNAVALAVAIAAVGVDYQVETTADKQQQYTIQIEPEIVKLVIGGEEIHSEVPAEAGQIQRLCIRIGMTRPQHSPAGEAAFRQLLVSASRWASADRTVAAAEPPAILWPARSNPEQTYGLRYGWQPDADGKQSYYVQIDPNVLRTLVAGDEIYAPIDPTAGRPNRFIISLIQKDFPPRIAAAGAVTPLPPAFQPGGQTPAGQASDFGNRSQFPAAGSISGGFGGSNTAPATGRSGDLGTFTPTEIPQPPATFQPGNADYSRQNPRLNPPTTAPPLIDNRSSGFNPATTAGGYSPAPVGGYGTGSSLEQPRSSFGASPPAAAPPATHPPANYYPPQQPLQVADSRGYGPADNSGGYSPPAMAGGYANAYPPPAENRLAANIAPQPLGSTPPGGSTVVAPGATPQKEGWGIFVVVLFALFFSIGGNLYLAWTALEFHNRYRSAIDRLRSAARSA